MAPLSATKAPDASPASQLILLIRGTAYGVSRLACDPAIGSKAFQLQKGNGTRYDIARTRHGLACDCPDFVYRREGLDPSGCKHVRALVVEGLLDPWPGPAAPVVDRPRRLK